ncbi:uncharacterized protein BT62DRAFT_954366 [Guyanagaster necrorhizus]|uniref:Phosphatidate phosphatase APP1 catalytic domain-containing protein n=1 Tax=Guyanagaster necrorhizus TaxID=856835 RepID=A0A9P7VKP8_9AGAR|nr:uncharacterized protein BT62DRAFT_954366 [Guyanagaster necrorhizus MCA 3950]KAG7442903.1 hypothetical protein BT62DRAFT_954366 [Guyanagaster necrorhizus MCA 3950]
MRFAALLLSFVLATARATLLESADEVLLFDAPAFQDPNNASNSVISLQSFVYHKQIDLTTLTNTLTAWENNGSIDKAVERLKLFAAVGVPGVSLSVDVAECSEQATLSATSGLPDLGLAVTNASIGRCEGGNTFTGTLLNNGDTISTTIFSSGTDGFGVISDIDDTAKVSHVLNKLEYVKTTLFDNPEPVPGMPNLYASLAKTLDNPPFIYITASPYQLFPLLRDFLKASFPNSLGPIFSQNLTLEDVTQVVDIISNPNDILDFKLSQIDRVQAMYPNKTFLTVGDSTQSDPEVYAGAYRKYGDFIRCIWIHRVDGANNSYERFITAFEGVPKNKYRIYTDNDIAGLADIDVAGGSC